MYIREMALQLDLRHYETVVAITDLGTMTAAALVLILQPQDPPSSLSTSYATPVAQRLAITLDDGTHVDLNAGTNLVIAHTDHERRVRLADGQAFFKVTKDASRPFIVETPAGSVRVTGTAFDVRTTSADEIEVTVLEGSVQVRLGQNNDPRHAGPIALGASDQLTSRREAAPTVQHLDEHAVSDALAWIDGQVVFSNTPLEQVLERFAHYHGRGISADAGARALRLSGRYALENLDSFFADLEAVLAVQVTHDQSGTTRVSLRN